MTTRPRTSQSDSLSPENAGPFLAGGQVTVTLAIKFLDLSLFQPLLCGERSQNTCSPGHVMSRCCVTQCVDVANSFTSLPCVTTVGLRTRPNAPCHSSGWFVPIWFPSWFTWGQFRDGDCQCVLRMCKCRTTSFCSKEHHAGGRWQQRAPVSDSVSPARPWFFSMSVFVHVTPWHVAQRPAAYSHY